MQPDSYLKVNSCDNQHQKMRTFPTHAGEQTCRTPTHVLMLERFLHEHSSNTTHLPLSIMWSRPPKSRSSSLNQSPALLEVRESNVSIAKWPVYKKQPRHHYHHHMIHFICNCVQYLNWQ